MIVLFLFFLKNFHIVLHTGLPTYIPTNSVGGASSLHPLQHLLFVDILVTAIQTSMRWYFIVLAHLYVSHCFLNDFLKLSLDDFNIFSLFFLSVMKIHLGLSHLKWWIFDKLFILKMYLLSNLFLSSHSCEFPNTRIIMDKCWGTNIHRKGLDFPLPPPQLIDKMTCKIRKD